MNIKNRILIIIFFIILSPVLGISGFVITSLIDPSKSFLPYDVVKKLNWFSENVDLSKNIAMGLYIAAGVFALIAIYNILAAAFDHSDGDNEIN